MPSLRRPVVLLLVALVTVVAVVVGVRLTSEGEGRPVLLVCGCTGMADEFEPLAEALRAFGRDVTIVDLPENGSAVFAESGGVPIVDP